MDLRKPSWDEDHRQQSDKIILFGNSSQMTLLSHGNHHKTLLGDAEALVAQLVRAPVVKLPSTVALPRLPVTYVSTKTSQSLNQVVDLEWYKEGEDVWYETDIQEQDKNKATNDKTEHGMEKTKSDQSQSQSKSKVNQVKKIQLKGLKLPNLKLYYKS
ncbi:hypothetical protein Tco_0319835 [Tanacetum coccineum]